MSHAKNMGTLQQLWKPTATAVAGTTLQQLQIQRDALQKALKDLDAIKPCCMSCQQFDVGGCKLHGEIPAEFQKVEGECPDWRYDAIPF